MVNESKRSIKINIIIGLLISILFLGFVLGFFLLRSNSGQDWNIVRAFKQEEEHTKLLDEFLVNLKSEDKSRNYLRIQIALMYGNEKDGKVLEANTNKIRDIIIKQLRNKTSDEMLDIDQTMEFKKDIINDINVTLRQNIVEDIYFTDLVIQ